MSINTREILQTIDMIKNQCLDIRTITMGISLRDCATGDAVSTRQRCARRYQRPAREKFSFSPAKLSMP